MNVLIYPNLMLWIDITFFCLIKQKTMFPIWFKYFLFSFWDYCVMIFHARICVAIGFQLWVRKDSMQLNLNYSPTSWMKWKWKHTASNCYALVCIQVRRCIWLLLGDALEHIFILMEFYLDRKKYSHHSNIVFQIYILQNILMGDNLFGTLYHHLTKLIH